MNSPYYLKTSSFAKNMGTANMKKNMKAVISFSGIIERIPKIMSPIEINLFLNVFMMISPLIVIMVFLSPLHYYNT